MWRQIVVAIPELTGTMGALEASARILNNGELEVIAEAEAGEAKREPPRELVSGDGYTVTEIERGKAPVAEVIPPRTKEDDEFERSLDD
jgi:hypothetical protein